MAGQWFSLGTPVPSTNKNECHDIAEILLKVAVFFFYFKHHNLNPFYLDKAPFVISTK
jgi:hypothetical protein